MHVTMTREELWSAPVPAPHLLKEYNELYPGLGTSLVQNFLKESDHRRDLEGKESARLDKIVDNEIWLRRVGLICGAILVATILGAAIYFGALKMTGLSSAFLAIVIGVAGVFVRRAWSPESKQSDELKVDASR